MRSAAALAAVSLLLGVSPALAQPGNTPPGPPPPAPYAAPAPAPYWQPPPARRTKRYGKTIAVVDAVSFAAVLVGVAIVMQNLNEEDPDNAPLAVGLMIGGSIGLFAGSPYVHYREGNSSGAWKALGLRLGVPLVASLLVEASKRDCDPVYETCDSDLDALPGLLLLGGMAIDWFVLAKVEVEVPVTPYAAPTPYGGATVGLGGSF